MEDQFYIIYKWALKNKCVLKQSPDEKILGKIRVTDPTLGTIYSLNLPGGDTERKLKHIEILRGKVFFK